MWREHVPSLKIIALLEDRARTKSANTFPIHPMAVARGNQRECRRV